jgi:hypothetical protein
MSIWPIALLCVVSAWVAQTIASAKTMGMNANIILLNMAIETLHKSVGNVFDYPPTDDL